jgi:hypothetical protein
VTAFELRDILRKALRGKDLSIIEVKFVVTKTNDIAKYEENIRNKTLPPIELQFNRLSGNAFLDEVFRELRPLKKYDGNKPIEDPNLSTGLSKDE